MKKIILLAFFSVVLVILYINSRKQGTVSNIKSHEINHEDFKKYIKERPYTILYFWVSWCGISQAGLINDYSKNYQYINNDTVQSLLIVASDTNSINSFMVKNNIKVPYKCLHEGSYLPLIGNITDGKNKEQFINDMFNYKGIISGFPTVLLVDSSFNGLMESDKTKDAVRIYRYFEKNKNINSNGEKLDKTKKPITKAHK